MYNKLEELERQLNPKTNGFALFKESAGAAIGWGMRTVDHGLEATDNIRPPKEIDVVEGLNLPHKRVFKKGDRVRVVDIPEGNSIYWLNGAIGTITDLLLANATNWFQKPDNVERENRAIVKFECATIPSAEHQLKQQIKPIVRAIPFKYLQHFHPASEVNEVSPYEESDWLISKSHKQEVKQISEWLKTTSEPYDDFHWNGADLLIMREGKVVETIERSVLAQQNIVAETRIINENHKYDYGCLMLYLDIPMWNAVMALIDSDDLYVEEEDFGLETKPHVTILYGIHDNEINLDEIKNELLGINEIPIKIIGISHFTNDNWPYDVVKFDVESELLRQLNKQLQKFPNTHEFDYNPHITIGYVKKGLGQKYDGQMPSVPTILGKKIVYSHPSGKKDIWELPMQSDVMNSPDDLMEGLNLMKKSIRKQPITQIIKMILPNSDEIIFPIDKQVNWNYIEKIEATEDWERIVVSYVDLNGNKQTTTLGHFKDTYFKIGSDYFYMMEDSDLMLHPITCFVLTHVENNRNGQILQAEDEHFIAKLQALLDTNDELNYVGYLSAPDYGEQESTLYYNEIEGPVVIILINNTFYTIMDSKIFPIKIEILCPD